MADKELLIEINADAKNATKAFDDMRSKTEDLEGKLNTVAKVSAVAFAALTAEVGFSVAAFADADAKSRSLTTALQNQGIYTGALEARYKSFAEAIEAKTNLDGDDIVGAQATAQAYLKQTQITQGLTNSIADLSVGMKMDLNSAAELIGKTIGTTHNAFARYGLVLDEGMTKQDRMAKVMDFVNSKFAGQAEAAAQGIGSIKGWGVAFGNVQEEIGQRFSPVIIYATKMLKDMAGSMKNSPELMNFIASLTAAGLVVSSIGIAIPLAVKGFLLFKAAMQAAGFAATGTQLAIKGLLGATGIGLLVIAITELALHWETVWPRMKAVAQGFIDFAVGAFGGLAKVLKAAFSLDMDGVKAGWAEIKDAYAKGMSEATAVIVDGHAKQEEKEKEAKNRRAVAVDEEQANLIERKKVFSEINIQTDAELAANELNSTVQLKAEQSANLQAMAMTEKDADRAIKEEALKKNIDAHNTQLIERKKYGAAYALINKAIHSDEVVGVKNATGEMVGMAQSKNASLRAIGKAAAISQIAISTATSAMNVFQGFSTIPFIGAGLGLAAAGAVIAYGAERLADVAGAREGALVEGGTVGRDSVPFMLEPGELVVPRKNFDEVIKGVNMARGDAPAQGSGGGYAEIKLSLTDNLIELVEARIIERRNLGISLGV